MDRAITKTPKEIPARNGKPHWMPIRTEMTMAAKSKTENREQQLRIIREPANPQKWPPYSEVALRYGCPGNGGDASSEWESRCLARLHLPYPMLTAWIEPDPHTRVFGQRRVEYALVHRECIQSLGRILNAILAHYGGDMERLSADGMDLFAGIYCYRPSRHHEALSLHAYGAAIDFGGDVMPPEIIAIFEDESWVWGGEDNPMHFEATKGK